jgi:hypothetical protein
MATLPEISEVDAKFVFLNGEAPSFCQQLPICHLFDLCHIFRKKAGLQGFIKKFVTPEPLEINNLFF